MHALTAFPLQQNIPPGSSGVVYMNTPDADANYYAAASFATYPGVALPGGRTLPLRFDELFFLTATGSAPNIF